jgi:hypothetical protein
MQGQELDEKTQPILWKKSQLVHLWVLVYSGPQQVLWEMFL